ncbi:MAG: hypothetical protein EBS72_15800, partial [Rhizobiales bacterium]|nr:hypothetical protein [Hyphomicrobiales bacterium]
MEEVMVDFNRRQFGGLLASGAALANYPAFAQSANPSFMSFTFAEDPNRPMIQKVIDDFKAQSGISMEPIGSAWGDVQKNLLLRQRSKTLPTTAQLSERWLPAIATIPEIVDLDQALGRAKLEAAIDPAVLAMG